MAASNRPVYNPAVEQASRAQLIELQRRRLTFQLAHAWDANPFYRQRWEAAGLQRGDLDDPTVLEALPLVRKDDFLADQEANPPYGDRLGVARDKLVLTHITSGSSGQGQEAFGVTPSDLDYGGQCWAYGLTWAGVRKGDVTFNLFPFATYAAGTSAHQGMQLLGCNTFSVAVLYDAKTVLERMQRFGARFLLTTPPYWLALTMTAQELGIDPATDFPELHAVMLATAPYGAQWAADMEERWQVTLHEMYGSSQQLTHLASTCERGALLDDGSRGVMHILEQYTVAEVLDPDTGAHVAPGEFGELVITTLGREASPALRYATGDRVGYQAPGACDCGLPLAGFEAGTVSRYDDMLKIKGVNVWPQTIDEVVLDHPAVEEYRGRVYIGEKGREAAEVRVDFAADVTEEQREQLLGSFAAQLRDRTTLGFRVAAAEKPLERYTFKARRWTDERQEGLEVKAL